VGAVGLRHPALSALRPLTTEADSLKSNALWWAPSIRDEGRVLDATDPGRLGVVAPHDVARK
jgi:hypothetical protein